MTIREIDLERDAEQLVARAATSGHRILGFVESGLDFFGSGDLARVGVRVDPEARRRGIGAKLYEIGLDHVRALGAARAATPAGRRVEYLLELRDS